MLGCTMPYIPLCTSKLVRCNLSSTLQKEQHGRLMTAGRRLGVKLPLACSTPYVPTSTYNRWLRANSTYSWKHIESQGVPFLFLFKNLERKRQQVDDYYQQRLAKTNNAITDCHRALCFLEHMEQFDTFVSQSTLLCQTQSTLLSLVCICR